MHPAATPPAATPPPAAAMARLWPDFLARYLAPERLARLREARR